MKKINLPAKISFGLGVILAAGVLSFGGILLLALVQTNNFDLAEIFTEDSATKDTTVTQADGGPVPTEAIENIDRTKIRNVRGSGDLTFIEYSDLECPFCKSFHPTVNELAEKYEGRVKIAFKHFPLNIHPKAKREAIAAECSAQQGKAFEFIDEIFTITPSNNGLEDSALFATAAKLELNIDVFTECVESEETLVLVAEDALEAQATGGQGTPHSLLIDKDGEILIAFKGALTVDQISETIDGFLDAEAVEADETAEAVE